MCHKMYISIIITASYIQMYIYKCVYYRKETIYLLTYFTCVQAAKLSRGKLLRIIPPIKFTYITGIALPNQELWTSVVNLN